MRTTAAGRPRGLGGSLRSLRDNYVSAVSAGKKAWALPAATSFTAHRALTMRRELYLRETTLIGRDKERERGGIGEREVFATALH